METVTDSVRELIRRKVRERGLYLTRLSQAIGKNAAYLQQFLERGVPIKLDEDVREKLAIELGVDAIDLKHKATHAKVSEISRNAGKILPLSNAPADKIPVLGIAQGGPDGWALWNGEIVDYIDRPPHLSGARNAYAVYVVGSSMEPRYFAGELVHIHPGKPVTPGSYVLVQLRNQEGETPLALIKRLVRRTGSKVVLEQHNPSKEVEVKLAEVISMHRIVGSAES